MGEPWTSVRPADPGTNRRGAELRRHRFRPRAAVPAASGGVGAPWGDGPRGGTGDGGTPAAHASGRQGTSAGRRTARQAHGRGPADRRGVRRAGDPGTRVRLPRRAPRADGRPPARSRAVPPARAAAVAVADRECPPACSCSSSRYCSPGRWWRPCSTGPRRSSPSSSCSCSCGTGGGAGAGERVVPVTPALPRRAGRRTNLALLGLLLLAFATGVLAYGVGTSPAVTVVVAVHGAAGLGLLLLVPWKAVIVRRSWARAANTRTLATGLGVLVALTLLTGVLHAIGVAPLSLLLIHVGLAVCVAPLVVVHAWGRRQRPRRTDLSRRTLLKAGALAAGAASLWAVGGRRAAARRRPGRRPQGHRLTGARHRRSGRHAGHPVVHRHRARQPAGRHHRRGRGQESSDPDRRPLQQGPRAGRPRLHRWLVRGTGLGRRPPRPAPAPGHRHETARGRQRRRHLPSPATAVASRSATRHPSCWPRRPPGSRCRPGTARRCASSRRGDAASGGSSGWSGSRSWTHRGGVSLPSR